MHRTELPFGVQPTHALIHGTYGFGYHTKGLEISPQPKPKPLDLAKDEDAPCVLPKPKPLDLAKDEDAPCVLRKHKSTPSVWEARHQESIKRQQERTRS